MIESILVSQTETLKDLFNVKMVVVSVDNPVFEIDL